MADFEIRPVTDNEWPGFVRTTLTAFGNVASDDDVSIDRRAWDLERSVAAVADGGVVGTAGAYTFDLTVPGLVTTPAAGVTWVGVLPTARRSGVLTAMMRHQLDDIRDRGEPVAVLLASESIIYGRFGYGLATMQAEYELLRTSRAFARTIETPGRVVLNDDDAAKKQLPAIHDRVRRLQPGDVSRPDGWWTQVWRGAKGRFTAIYEGPTGEAEGYATYRVGNSPAAAGPQRRRAAMVDDFGATTFDAYVALWAFVTDIDLTEVTTTFSRPLDEPFRYLLADPRKLRATEVHDYLWCRVVDVGAALAARRYTTDDRFVLEIRDEFCPWNDGRWELTGGPDGATCTRSTAEADLSLSAADLGAVYLGGTRLASLARARRVTCNDPARLRRADAFFVSDVAPYCRTHF